MIISLGTVLKAFVPINLLRLFPRTDMPYYANDDNVIKTRLFQEEKNLKKFFSKYAAVSASGTSASNGSNDL